MNKRAFLIGMITVVILFAGCKKEKDFPEKSFYGSWVYRTDTVFFYNRNGINILKTKQIITAMNPEREFEFRNDTLRLKDSVSLVADFYPVNSFKWLQKGKSFEISTAAFYPVSNDSKRIYMKVK